jgi:hypothetical protein
VAPRRETIPSIAHHGERMEATIPWSFIVWYGVYLLVSALLCLLFASLSDSNY